MIASVLFGLVGVVASLVALLYARYRFFLSQSFYCYPATTFLGGSAVADAIAKKNEKEIEHFADAGAHQFTQYLLPLGLGRLMIVSNPQWVEYILGSNLPKNPLIYEPFNYIPGKSNLFTHTNQAEWSRLRKSFSHAFSGSALKNQYPVVEQVVARWFNVLDAAAESGSVVKFDDSVSLMTFDIICQVGLGLDFDAIDNDGLERELLNTLSRALPEMYLQALDPLRKFSGRPEVKQYKADLARVIEISRKFKTEAKNSIHASEGRKGIIEIIEGIEGLSDDERLANFLGFVVAGHDTTAHGLSFSLYNLISHPEAMAKCVAEVNQVFGDSASQCPDYASLTQLTYLTQCIKESWRMYSPGTGTSRVLEETKTIDGVTLDKGTMVAVFASSMNYNPVVWADPFAFKPERWTKEAEASRPKCSLMTFSSGPRDCIGKTMAANETIAILAALLRRYEFRLEKGYRFVYEHGFVGKPKYDVPVYLKRR